MIAFSASASKEGLFFWYICLSLKTQACLHQIQGLIVPVFHLHGSLNRDRRCYGPFSGTKKDKGVLTKGVSAGSGFIPKTPKICQGYTWLGSAVHSALRAPNVLERRICLQKSLLKKPLFWVPGHFGFIFKIPWVDLTEAFWELYSEVSVEELLNRNSLGIDS